MRFQHRVGLGDVVKYGLGKLGIKACGGCEQRRQTLNRWTPGYQPQGPGFDVIRTRAAGYRILYSPTGKRSPGSVGWLYGIAGGSDLQCATGERDEVAAKFTAAVTGDRVLIPGGTYIWATGLPVGSKAITVQGVGPGTAAQCASTGQKTATCLTMGPTATSILGWTMVPGALSRMTGITFDGGLVGNNNTGSGVVNFAGSSDQFRLDHCRIIAQRNHGFQFHGNVRGVVDHCAIETPRTYHFGGYVHHEGWGGGANSCPGYVYGCGDKSWAADTNPGSGDFLFFEDNEWTAKAAPYLTDGWSGQRVVYRYNTITGGTFQNHGTDSPGRARGGRWQEAYRNRFHVTTNIGGGMGNRGGSGLYHGNVAYEEGFPANYIVSLTHYRLSTEDIANCADGVCNFCSYFNCCDTPQASSAHTQGNIWDAGSGTTNGYPCMDQIGRGKGLLMVGDETTVGTEKLQSTGKKEWPQQQLEPIYAFANKKSTGVNWPVSRHVSNASYFVVDRDYYIDSAASGSPQTSGVRVGPGSARPASCSGQVGYWATDEGAWNKKAGEPQGRLYTCQGGQWALYYTPYTYPHPLVSGGVGPVLDTIPPTITITNPSRRR